MTEERAASGSCRRCGEALDLASTKVRGVWYCRASCAAEADDGTERAGVPETWLTVRPRRFYRKRMPKELNAPARPRGGTRSAR